MHQEFTETTPTLLFYNVVIFCSQAMIDVTAEYGWLTVCLSCQMLMQCIIQARWLSDSPLTTLPYIESQHLYMFLQMARDSNKPCTHLNGLKIATINNYELLAKYLRKELEENQIAEIHKVNMSFLFFLTP